MVVPGMSDGRCFTSYTSNCQYNTELMNTVSAKDNNEYRKYLQDNTDYIMKVYKSQGSLKSSDCIQKPSQ